jgi:hypothetical protein
VSTTQPEERAVKLTSAELEHLYAANLRGEALAAVERIVAARLAAAWDEGCSHAGGPDVVPCPENPYRAAVRAEPSEATV